MLHHLNEKTTIITYTTAETKKDINFQATNMSMIINSLKKTLKEPFKQIAYIYSKIDSLYRTYFCLDLSSSKSIDKSFSTLPN
jgi:hypothetical protein